MELKNFVLLHYIIKTYQVSHQSSFQEKTRFDYPDLSWFSVVLVFFPPRVWWFSTLPFGSPGSLILSDLQYWEADTPAKGLLPLTRLFTSCSQHPAYTLQFHVKSMMFLTGIQQKICCMPVLCSFLAMSSSKEGLDEIIFCVDISLLWGCWTGSMQRHISIQTCKRQSPPPKSNH